MLYGINGIMLAVAGFLGGRLSKSFSKDSRITIMLMVAGMTVLAEAAMYFLSYIVFSINLEILVFARILAIQVLFNVIITVIIYPLIQKAGYAIENEYNSGSKILTKYF